MKHGILFSWTLAVLLAASAFGSETPPERPARPATGIAPPKRLERAVIEPAPMGEPLSIAALPARIRRAVVADAARRFQVAESAVVVTRAEQVTWPDGSLGCPQPGRMYTQMLVPGYRLVAKTAQGEFLYHADARGNLATCAVALRKSPHDQRESK